MSVPGNRNAYLVNTRFNLRYSVLRDRSLVALLYEEEERAYSSASVRAHA